MVSLPISVPADDGRAWSDFGGIWHPVEVRYHGRGPLGRFVWGCSPWAGIGRALLVALYMAGPTFVVAVALSAFMGYRDDPVRFALIFLVVMVAGPIVMAVLDMGARATVCGQVVRQRKFVKERGEDNPTYRYWMGIDDGHHRLTHAYGIDAEMWSTLAEGDIVEAQVGKWLGWIHEVRIVTPSRHRHTATPADPTSQ